MEVYCTRWTCPHPQNNFADLDDPATLKTTKQKYCTTCGMPLFLLEQYIPSKLLGKGGFGAAFLARARYTPGFRKCVVKQFKPSGELTTEQLDTAQKLFEREAEVLELIGSQNNQIPDLFAFFDLTVPSLQPPKQEQFFYLVQEFIDGKNLEEELQEKGKFSEAKVMEVLLEVLKILEFVHNSGSIHRDIKPSNIMRHKNGRLYLLDFGAVKQVASTATNSASTGIYSMGFAPPEQMSGKQVYPSTDLYALAVTCVMLLTGKEATQLLDSYSNQWSWQQEVTISPTLANVLDKMLQAAPNQRFSSAQAAIEALAITTPPLNPVANPSQPLAPITTPAPIATPPPTPAPVRQQSRPSFSTWELLGSGAFTGFEGGLIAIALLSLLGTTLISTGAWLVLLGALMFVQWRRWIEKVDLLIIAGITLGLVLFLPGLNATVSSFQGIGAVQAVLILAIVGALVAIALTAIFRLIYKLLSRIL
ncbi:serine/threonine-protein kinase [Chlorogloea sp. CCALA 695]|uniref:serine/threonine-protein kinase n=1 Tax=Chlorogloea sp. CCALA 695 TaxID=2107693 RepID=UPI000D061CA5|nr:serine/threonine-protein kinase [Chlorogloea sp. CCALA 695]PSB31138.1 serine/threonine protein kinase [Chlorogloea sp. CCALA 695]